MQVIKYLHNKRYLVISTRFYIGTILIYLSNIKIFQVLYAWLSPLPNNVFRSLGRGFKQRDFKNILTLPKMKGKKNKKLKVNNQGKVFNWLWINREIELNKTQICN
jgi:hypothetical protein